MAGKKSNNLVTRILKSVSAAFLGVQSEENAQKDFSENHFSYYAVVGVIFTIAFVLTVIMIVQFVLPE